MTGRWTVYRLKFNLKGEGETKQFVQMLDALHDFNVNTEIAHELEVSTDRAMLKPVWDFINTSSTKDSSLLELMIDAKPTLSYAVRYQLEVCISRNCLNEYNMGEEFVNRLAALAEHDAVSILEYVADSNRFYNPMEIFDVRDIKTASTVAKLPDYCAIMRKANVTPSTVYYSTPSVETTNRVVRHFKEHADRFLRVQFKDELSQVRIHSYEYFSSLIPSRAA
jgi:RNA-dependent RNA polymerase